MIKVCIKCGESKEILLFKKNAACVNGRGNICRKCDSIRATALNKANRGRRAEYEQKWRAENKEKTAKYKLREKAWAADNPDKVKAYKRKYRSSPHGAKKAKEYQDQYNKANSVIKTTKKLAWMKANKGRCNAATAKRLAYIRRATPVWAEQDKIKMVYTKAAEFNFEVDHVVPLRSPKVCGLHTWENLQLLEREVNMSKGNRIWPEMPA